MTQVQGIFVYEILPSGCLNGIGSNNHTVEKFNEIARMVESKSSEDGLIGEYICSYIDIDNKVYQCELSISKGKIRKNKTTCQYDFIWKRNKQTIFEGSGWKTRENEITVSYHD